MNKKFLILIIGILLISSTVSAIPNITNISIIPLNPTLNDEITICADVTDIIDIIFVRINLHAENPLWNWGLIMDKQGERYCKSLSPLYMAAYVGKQITYYISARNVLSETTTTQTFNFTYRAVPFCGDGICNDNETCSTCSNDCGECQSPPQNDLEYNLSLFSDLESCKSGVHGNITLSVKDPDKGDKFKPGDEINVKINIKNEADEKKEIVVEAYLYNINEDNIEAEADDKENIKAGKKESFELTLEIPDDFEKDQYLVFVKAYEEDNEELQCSQTVIDIDLEREKHDVIIKKISLTPLSIIAGESLDIFVEVQNTGKSDEDVYIVLEIGELNISTESEVFELEKFGEDDSFSDTFSVQIPYNAQAGEYKLIIKSVFDGKEDEKIENISVLEKRVSTEIRTIDLPTEKESRAEKVLIEIQKALEIPSALPIALFIGIIILITLIIIVKKNNP